MEVPGSEPRLTPNGDERWIVMATREWRAYPGSAMNPVGITLLVGDVEHPYGEPAGTDDNAWHGVTAIETRARRRTRSRRRAVRRRSVVVSTV